VEWPAALAVSTIFAAPDAVGPKTIMAITKRVGSFALRAQVTS
jgi:hypothetical protein